MICAVVRWAKGRDDGNIDDIRDVDEEEWTFSSNESIECYGL